MTKRFLAAIAIAASLLGLSACAGSYQDRIAGSYGSSYKRGYEALRAKDFERAAEEYAAAVGSGHPKALIAYGRLFARGQGVDADPARAVALFEEAHSKTSAFKGKAAVELGLALLKGGEGPSGTVERDVARARGLLLEALDDGQSRAAPSLGRIYEKGLGVISDPERAIEFYRQAPPNDAYASRNLALLLSKTGATEADLARAAERTIGRFEVLANAGNSSAWVQLAEIYSRDEIIEPDPERAIGYLKNINQSDDPALQIRLARIYSRLGEEEERNRMLRLAADGGDVSAQTQLARLYLKPRTAYTNGAVGRYYAERAIGQGSHGAMVYLGQAMLRGKLVERAPLLGETLLRRASDSGYLAGTVALGAAILKGDVKARLANEGQLLLEIAADKGSANAMRVLGFAYQKGRGLPENQVLAQKWLRKAADSGDRRAKEALSQQQGA